MKLIKIEDSKNIDIQLNFQFRVKFLSIKVLNLNIYIKFKANHPISTKK